MVIDKATLLKNMALKTALIPMDGGDVSLKELSAVEYMEVYNSLMDDKGEVDSDKLTSMLVVRSILDKKGQRMFTDEEAKTLREGSSMRYAKLAIAVNKLHTPGTDLKN